MDVGYLYFVMNVLSRMNPDVGYWYCVMNVLSRMNPDVGYWYYVMNGCRVPVFCNECIV